MKLDSTVAAVVTAIAQPFGFGHRLTPTTSGESYPLQVPFDGNVLTSDREMWAFMRRQIEVVPDLGLGGPTLTWLGHATVLLQVASIVQPPHRLV